MLPAGRRRIFRGLGVTAHTDTGARFLSSEFQRREAGYVAHTPRSRSSTGDGAASPHLPGMPNRDGVLGGTLGDSHRGGARHRPENTLLASGTREVWGSPGGDVSVTHTEHPKGHMPHRDQGRTDEGDAPCVSSCPFCHCPAESHRRGEGVGGRRSCPRFCTGAP